MINAQFDLQNIINEMKTADRASESSSKSGTEPFSETLDRVSRADASTRRSTSMDQTSSEAGQRSATEQTSDPKDEADTESFPEDPEVNSTQGMVSQESGHTSGNILPLLPPERPSVNQVMLESNRPILVGDLKAAASMNENLQNLADSEGLEQASIIGSKNSLDSAETGQTLQRQRDSAETGQTLQSQRDNDSMFLTGLSSKLSKLASAGKPDADGKDHSASNNIYRSVDVRNSDLAPESKSSALTSTHALDTHEFKEGLSKIIKNQIVSSFSGKNVTLKMVLTPESLGEIEVDLRFTKDSNLQVTLRPETLEIAKLIQTNAASLREQLSQEHKGLLSLNVSDHFSDEEKRNGNSGSGSGNKENDNFVSLEKQNLRDSDPSEFVRTNKGKTSSLIDTFV
ncbi:MAG: hypothetical protein CMM57_10690 [Rhodospirillaceae bacterium]|nr:hypothetical protein [Rhodospirillaceae bacterium]